MSLDYFYDLDAAPSASRRLSILQCARTDSGCPIDDIKKHYAHRLLAWANHVQDARTLEDFFGETNQAFADDDYLRAPVDHALRRAMKRLIEDS